MTSEIKPEYKDPRCKGCCSIMSKRKWNDDVQAWHYYCPSCEWRNNKEDEQDE